MYIRYRRNKPYIYPTIGTVYTGKNNNQNKLYNSILTYLSK